MAVVAETTDTTVTLTGKKEDRPRRQKKNNWRRPAAAEVPPRLSPWLLFVMLAALPIVDWWIAGPSGDRGGGAGAPPAITLGTDAFRLGWGGGGRPPTTISRPTWSRPHGTAGGSVGDVDGEGRQVTPPHPAMTMDEHDDPGRRPWLGGDEEGGGATTTTQQMNNNDNRKRQQHKKRVGFIPPEEVERIKSRVDLVDFVENYSDPPLERFSRSSSGNRATAICPFHDDTNPSLGVDTERGLYACFACGAGGDVFNFVREYDYVVAGGGGEGEKMGFREAVEVVRDYVETGGGGGGGGGGIKWTPSPASKRRGGKASVSVKKKKRILLANAAAAAFYHRSLVSLPGAGAARSHLRGRGLKPSTVKAFCLGYAPDAYFGPSGSRGWTRGGGGTEGSLVQHLRGLGFTPNEIVDSGLATRPAGRGRRGGGGMVGAKATAPIVDEGNHTDASTGLVVPPPGNGTASASEVGGNAGLSEPLDNVTASTGGGDAEDARQTNDEKFGYDELMDRFRNRLIVPIFDEDGASVVALGGRHLDAASMDPTARDPTTPPASMTGTPDRGDGGETTPDHPPSPAGGETTIESAAATTKAAFKAAKYINSPESAVFSKKRCLFGIHAARASLRSDGGDAGTDDVHPPSAAASTIATRTTREEDETDAADGGSQEHRRGRRLAIVEGYLDALVLHDAGVAEAVACMGTALTAEQLTLAAEIVVGGGGDGGGGGSGAIILCLDGDQAGIAAVERVCESRVVSEVLENFDGLEILVATMPDGVKDPAEFIERGIGRVADHDADVDIGCAFRREILDGAMQWSDWYLLRLVARYEKDEGVITDAGNDAVSRADGAPLADVCEAVSDFISTFDDPPDRARHANQAAHALVMKFIGPEGANGSSPSPSALRIQLESDILDLSVRKARGRALARKIESANREKGKHLSGRTKAAIMSKLTRGESTAGADYIEFESVMERGKGDAEDRLSSQRSSSNGSFVSQHRRRWSEEGKRLAVPQPALVPHFAGFEFANPNDVHWLGLESKQGGLLLGMNGKHGTTKDKGTVFAAGGNSRMQKGRTVYFNSNEYLGYNDGTTAFDPSISRLTEDPNRILLASEERLLRHLVEYGPARKTMKAALTMSMKSNNASDFIEWSEAEREWLFHCLVDIDNRQSPLPEELHDGGTMMQLREHLSARKDAPIGAFCSNLTTNFHREINNLPIDASMAVVVVDDRLNASTGRDAEAGGTTPHDVVEDFPEDARAVEVNESGENDSTMHAEVVTVDDVDSSEGREGRVPNGTLDMFFFPQDDDFFHLPEPTMARDMRADLVVQETLATILRAQSAKRMHEMKKQWHDARRAFPTRAEAGQSVERNAAENIDSVALTELSERVGGASPLESMDVEELHDHCDRLGTALSEATTTARELNDAARRMGSRFLDYSSTGGISFAQSVAKEEELAKMVDEFVADLPEDTHIPETPGDDGRYVFGSDEYDDLIDPLYGGRHRDDGVPEEGGDREPMPSAATEDASSEDGLVDMIKKITHSDGASSPKSNDDDERRGFERATTTPSEEEEEMIRLLDDYISGLPEDALGSDDSDDVAEDDRHGDDDGSPHREQQQHRFERVIRARRATEESSPDARKPAGRGWAWTASGWAWNPLSFDDISSEEEGGEDVVDTP